MAVNRTISIVMASLFLAMFSSPCGAQSNRKNFDPLAQQHSSAPTDGFLDFTLKRINPSNKDYGQCIEEGRKLLLDETIQSGYFWSNLTSLGLLSCLFTIIVWQRRVLARREESTAEILTQYEHVLSRANAQIAEATVKNQGLAEALAVLRESAMRAQATPQDLTEQLRTPASRTRAVGKTQDGPPVQEKDSAKQPASNTSSAVTAAPSGDQIRLFKPDAEMVMKVNSLEQQLGQSRNEATLLRKQLNKADQRAQLEQKKNQTLKGE
jgi:hypothetical protein